MFTILWVVALLALGGFAGTKMIPHVYQANCVGCEDCIRICPVRKKGAIFMENGKAVINPEVCIACNRCIGICSFNAVKK